MGAPLQHGPHRRACSEDKAPQQRGRLHILKACDTAKMGHPARPVPAQKPEDFSPPLCVKPRPPQGIDMNKVVELLRERQKLRAAKDLACSDVGPRHGPGGSPGHLSALYGYHLNGTLFGACGRERPGCSYAACRP